MMIWYTGALPFRWKPREVQLTQNEIGWFLVSKTVPPFQRISASTLQIPHSQIQVQIYFYMNMKVLHLLQSAVHRLIILTSQFLIRKLCLRIMFTELHSLVSLCLKPKKLSNVFSFRMALGKCFDICSMLNSLCGIWRTWSFSDPVVICLIWM